jgi:hypothetical protein
MDVNDRLTRLENALIDLAVVVSGGHLDHLASANMSPVVVEAGRQLQAFHRAVIDEREFVTGTFVLVTSAHSKDRYDATSPETNVARSGRSVASIS